MKAARNFGNLERKCNEIQTCKTLMHDSTDTKQNVTCGAKRLSDEFL
jgi:hypothetical protein